MTPNDLLRRVEAALEQVEDRAEERQHLVIVSIAIVGIAIVSGRPRGGAAAPGVRASSWLRPLRSSGIVSIAIVSRAHGRGRRRR